MLSVPENLSFVRYFEFTVPLSIEDCSEHLNHLSREQFKTYSVHLSPVHPKQVQFTIRQSAGKLGEAWAVGYLQATSGGNCQIIGKAGIPRSIVIRDTFTYTAIVLGIGLLFLLLQSNPVYLFCFTLLLGFLLFVNWFGLISTRDALTRKLDLSQPIPPKMKPHSEG